MNNQLLHKIIKYNNKNPPETLYDNPLLDRRYAGELAKSFVKILSASNQNTQNNNNLRHCILENIRKICNIDNDNHIKLTDGIFEILIEFYKKYFSKDYDGNTSERQLQDFFVRYVNENYDFINANTRISPETTQALININNGVLINEITAGVMRWDTNNLKWQALLSYIWDNLDFLTNEVLINDVCIKMKPEIEKQFLDLIYEILSEDKIKDSNKIIEENQILQSFVMKSSKSKECFRLCIEILNNIFISTNFNEKLEKFISIFVRNVNKNVLNDKFPTLYPENLQCLVILMNVDILFIKNDCFINEVCRQLVELEKGSKNYLIMLLSHYPEWFELYQLYVYR